MLSRQCRQPLVGSADSRYAKGTVALSVGSADGRYAKGTVALTVSIYRIHAAVRSFCPVTETERIGSIARERRACCAHGASAACKSRPVISDGTGERRDKEGEREGAT